MPQIRSLSMKKLICNSINPSDRPIAHKQPIYEQILFFYRKQCAFGEGNSCPRQLPMRKQQEVT